MFAFDMGFDRSGDNTADYGLHFQPLYGPAQSQYDDAPTFDAANLSARPVLGGLFDQTDATLAESAAVERLADMVAERVLSQLNSVNDEAELAVKGIMGSDGALLGPEPAILEGRFDYDFDYDYVPVDVADAFGGAMGSGQFGDAVDYDPSEPAGSPAGWAGEPVAFESGDAGANASGWAGDAVNFDPRPAEGPAVSFAEAPEAPDPGEGPFIGLPIRPIPEPLVGDFVYAAPSPGHPEPATGQAGAVDPSLFDPAGDSGESIVEIMRGHEFDSFDVFDGDFSELFDFAWL
ncbi:MAG: hypothetical protein RKE49_12665 [Oceanicaulis sp.]